MGVPVLHSNIQQSACYFYTASQLQMLLKSVMILKLRNLVSLLFLLWLAASPSGSDKGSFSSVLTGPAVDPVHGVRLESTVPAIDLALQYVSNATNLLPDVNLTYNQIQVLEVVSFI